jgi:hypothetical protein
VLATGVLEGIHFTVEDGVVLLDALVVAATDDFVVNDDDGADGDATFGKALARFGDGFSHEV